MMDFDPLMGAEMARVEELGLFDSRETLLDRVVQVLAASHSFGEPISDEDFEEACLECGVAPEIFTDDEIEWMLECVEEL